MKIIDSKIQGHKSPNERDVKPLPYLQEDQDRSQQQN